MGPAMVGVAGATTIIETRADSSWVRICRYLLRHPSLRGAGEGSVQLLPSLAAVATAHPF
jgi:hypothetical protein